MNVYHKQCKPFFVPKVWSNFYFGFFSNDKRVVFLVFYYNFGIIPSKNIFFYSKEIKWNLIVNVGLI